MNEKVTTAFKVVGLILSMLRGYFLIKNKLIKLDDRRSYGEVRYQVTGLIEGRIYVVVFTPRKEKLRIISARKPTAKEREKYEEGI